MRSLAAKARSLRGGGPARGYASSPSASPSSRSCARSRGASSASSTSASSPPRSPTSSRTPSATTRRRCAWARRRPRKRPGRPAIVCPIREDGNILGLPPGGQPLRHSPDRSGRARAPRDAVRLPRGGDPQLAPVRRGGRDQAVPGAADRLRGRRDHLGGRRRAGSAAGTRPPSASSASPPTRRSASPSRACCPQEPVPAGARQRSRARIRCGPSTPPPSGRTGAR